MLRIKGCELPKVLDRFTCLSWIVPDGATIPSLRLSPRMMSLEQDRLRIVCAIEALQECNSVHPWSRDEYQIHLKHGERHSNEMKE